jgi:hypothetical protein
VSAPSHAAVLEALLPLADSELARWTRSADSYGLFEDPGVTLPGCRAWVLSPVGATTPVGVRLVEADGALTVTSQRPDAIAGLLADHPPAEASLPRVFFHLWTVPGRAVEPIAGTETVRRAGDTLVVGVDVQDRWRGRMRWGARVTPRRAHVTMTEIPG